MTELLNLRPSRAMRSLTARKSYRSARIQATRSHEPATQPPQSKCHEQPDRDANFLITDVIDTIRLLKFCHRMGVPHFVFASSRVYGPETPLPAREDHPANPCSPHALTNPQQGRA
ncbi:MAG: NAD-dependent epimerase/dehydratase family protein [Verrucomicrobia bacterium]|nr:NAD-dependent epimerase/dehydratase family protein [Verrucomicrobiota bacterium]